MWDKGEFKNNMYVEIMLQECHFGLSYESFPVNQSWSQGKAWKGYGYWVGKLEPAHDLQGYSLWSSSNRSEWLPSDGSVQYVHHAELGGVDP